jgi:hypothetical protein
MVQQSTVISEPVWAHPGGLNDLLDYLRAWGFGITANEYAVSHELIVALINRGVDVRDANIVKSCLGPVLCTSPREQAVFPLHFDRWATRRFEEQSVKQPTDSVLEKESRRWITWRWISALVSIALTVALVLWWRASQAPLATSQEVQQQVNAPTKTLSPAHAKGAISPLVNVILVAVASVMMTAVAWGLWSFYRGRMFLKRRPAEGEPDLLTIELESRLPESVVKTLRKIAFQMRRRRAIPSLELDIARSTEATLRNNGTFAPAFRTQYIQPEYVFLIDRRSFNDQGAQYLDELAEELIRAQVWITRYYFDEDPRILAPRQSGRALTLYELCATNQDRRVLLFADAASLIDPVRGDLAAWTQSLRSLREAALFTPKPREMWGNTEQRTRQVVRIHPATMESIEDFVLAMGGIPVSNRNAEATEGPYPPAFSLHPERWIERDPPDPTLVEDAMGSVRRWLGEDGYFWIAAVAVYPEIHFNLTEYLGATLIGSDGLPLFTPERFTAMSRLPWMRAAYMPDWLRLRLLSGINKEQNAQIREALNALWLSVATGGNRPIELEIARRNPLAVKSITKMVYRALSRKSAKDSILRDRVFASVMLGRSLDPLAVRIPRMWRQFMRAEKQREIPESRTQKWIWLCFASVYGTFASTGSALLAIRIFFPYYSISTFTWPFASEGGEWCAAFSGPIGLLIGVVTLNRRILWSSWFSVIGLTLTILAYPLIPGKFPVVRMLETRQKGEFIISTLTCFCILVSLWLVQITVRQIKTAPVSSLWRRLYIKALVCSTVSAESWPPCALYWTQHHHSRDLSILWFMRYCYIGIGVLGIATVFPGIRLRSRPLISLGLLTIASPLVIAFSRRLIPDRYWMICTVCWAAALVGQSLWVANRIGARFTILDFIPKLGLRLLRSVSPKATRSVAQRT